MRNWKLYCLGIVASIGLGTQAQAQPAAPAAPANLWSFLLPSGAQMGKLRAKFRDCPPFVMLRNAKKPLSLATGGLVQDPDKKPNAEALKADKDEGGAVGEAAKIKEDEANAMKRRLAVRYLGTVDCHYWPEAEKALINALRGDRNECVRLEAALALQRGCCCTADIVEALTITALGLKDKKFGYPYEKSERVRAAAADALSRCSLEVVGEPKKEGEIKKVRGDMPEVSPEIRKLAHQAVTHKYQNRPEGLLEIIGQALAQGNQGQAAPGTRVGQPVPAAPVAPVARPEGKGLLQIMNQNNLYRRVTVTNVSEPILVPQDVPTTQSMVEDRPQRGWVK